MAEHREPQRSPIAEHRQAPALSIAARCFVVGFVVGGAWAAGVALVRTLAHAG